MCFLPIAITLTLPLQPLPPADIHQFCWDASPTATHYHIKTANLGEVWLELATITAPDRCWSYDMNFLPTGLTGLVVTASNTAGESTTEHGEAFGD